MSEFDGLWTHQNKSLHNVEVGHYTKEEDDGGVIVTIVHAKQPFK